MIVIIDWISVLSFLQSIFFAYHSTCAFICFTCLILSALTYLKLVFFLSSPLLTNTQSSFLRHSYHWILITHSLTFTFYTPTSYSSVISLRRSHQNSRERCESSFTRRLESSTSIHSSWVMSCDLWGKYILYCVRYTLLSHECMCISMHVWAYMCVLGCSRICLCVCVKKSLLFSQRSFNEKRRISTRSILIRPHSMFLSPHTHTHKLPHNSYWNLIFNFNCNFNINLNDARSMEPIMDNGVQTLSGGELQRCAIVLCLGTAADIYLVPSLPFPLLFFLICCCTRHSYFFHFPSSSTLPYSLLLTSFIRVFHLIQF